MTLGTRGHHTEAQLLGVDIGGTGSRVAIGSDPDDAEVMRGPGVRIDAAGATVAQLIEQLLDEAAGRWPERFAAVSGIGVGATGIVSLVRDPQGVAEAIGRRAGKPSAAATDAVTAHLGALDGRGGAVTVLGTGAVAISHPGRDQDGSLPPQWRRIDGWGHLLGDRGGGAWIGRAAMEAALRHVDGVALARSQASEERLLLAATARFGQPEGWPSQLYTRDDRAAIMAGFAHDVAELAADGDAAARAIIDDAGREAARSALAALQLRHPRRAALLGGASGSDALRAAFDAEIARADPSCAVVGPTGDPLRGALVLAREAAEHRVAPQTATVWVAAESPG